MININIRIERDLSHNYLVPEVRNPFSKEDYQIHMLTENRISGLLDMKVHHMDGFQEYYYDITSQISMEQVYENEYMKEEDILCIIMGLAGVVREIGKYLLEEDSILLEPSCIYMDQSAQNPCFCYLPGHKGNLEEDFGSLAEYILRHLDQNDQRAVLLGYEIYRQAAQKNYSLEAVLKKAVEYRNGDKNLHTMDPESAATGRRENNILKKLPDEREVQKETIPFDRTSAGRMLSEEAGTIEPWADGNDSQPIPRKNLQIRKETTGEPSQRKHSDNRKRQKAETSKKQKRKGKTGNQRKTKKNAKTRSSACTRIVATVSVILLSADIALTYLKYLTTTQGGGIAFLIVGLFGFILSDHKKDTVSTNEEGKESEEEMNAGATRVLMDGPEEYKPRLSLIGLSSRDRITVVLQKDTYFIGKQKSKVDVFINDPAISRIHAKITREGEDYFLSDMNSTNGTFYNGTKLKNGEKVKLELTDEITFAETGFYVGNG